MLIALSAVGAVIKLFGTVALDSMPGYFAALSLGGWYGAIVISLGHIFTALTSGFPLGVAVHFYIAIQMAVYAYLFKFVYEKSNSFLAVIAGTPIKRSNLYPIVRTIIWMGVFCRNVPSINYSVFR